MSNALPVGSTEAVRDLHAVVDGLAVRERATSEHVAQAFSLQQLRYQERSTFILPDVM